MPLALCPSKQLGSVKDLDVLIRFGLFSGILGYDCSTPLCPDKLGGLAKVQ